MIFRVAYAATRRLRPLQTSVAFQPIGRLQPNDVFNQWFTAAGVP